MTNEITYPSISAKSRLPSFVRKDFQRFTLFIEKYYEWIEQNGYGALENQLKRIDVSQADDETLEIFSSIFLKDFPKETAIEKAMLLKEAYNLFQSKGSEEAFKFFFRSLFNEDVSFYYPKEDILRASDGKWEFVRSLRTTYNENYLGLQGRRIIGEQSGAIAVVDSVISYFLGSFEILEIFLDEVDGEFLVDEKIIEFDNSANFVMPYGVIANPTVTNAGTGYSVGDVIAFDNTGTNGIEGAARVSSVTRGVVESINIVDGGTDYEIGDELIFSNGIGSLPAKGVVTDVDIDGAITEVKLLLKGFNYSILPSITIQSDGGQDAILQAVSSSIGGVETIEIVSFGVGYESSPTLNLSGIGDGNATATIDITALSETSGRWRNNDGFLSDRKFILDSFFYQEFSYVLRSVVPPDDYQSVVRKILHPAGMEFFVEELFTFLIDIGAGFQWNLIRELNFYDFMILLGLTFDWIPVIGLQDDVDEQALGMTYEYFDFLKYLYDSDIKWSDYYHFHDVNLESFEEQSKRGQFDFIPDFDTIDLNKDLPFFEDAELWIDSEDDLSYRFSSSTNIDRLYDKSSNNFIFEQDNTGNQFTRGIDQINGIEVINSTSESFMVLENNLNNVLNGDNSIFIVYEPQDVTKNIFMIYGGSKITFPLIELFASPEPFIQTGIKFGDNFRLLVNAAYVTDVDGVSNISNPDDNVYLGTEPDGNYFQGKIAEIIVYNRTLNNSERNQVHAYLSEKWLITLETDQYSDEFDDPYA